MLAAPAALTAALTAVLPASSLLSGVLALAGLDTAGASAADEPAQTLTGLEALQLLGVAAGAAVVALVAAMVLHALVARAGRRSEVARALAARAKRPTRWLLVLVAVQQVLVRSSGDNAWLGTARHAALIAVLAAAGWLVAMLAFVVEDLVLARYRVDVADNRHARRVRTQMGFLRRIVVVVVALLTLAAVLWTFPEARGVGTGIFASAGLLSVVAGLAAQSSLSNVFAGLQLAFTDALRVDDVVVVEQEWGRIEEITLTYVVVHLWDDRRLVLPSTYFTSTPFENWTRRDSQLLGVVLLEVDWGTDFDAMREELHRVLEADELWDRRVAVLQVTDAVGSFVQVRVMVSAKDGPTIFDLRCHVREALVRWLVAEDPGGLPRLRLEREDAVRAPRAPREQPRPAPRRVEPSTPATEVLPAVPGAAGSGPASSGRDDSLFTGSLEALERSRRFAGPPEDEQAARAAGDEHDEHAGHDGRGGHEEPGTSTQVIPAVPDRR